MTLAANVAPSASGENRVPYVSPYTVPTERNVSNQHKGKHREPSRLFTLALRQEDVSVVPPALGRTTNQPLV